MGTITGTPGSDILSSTRGDTLVGGLGDDTYTGWFSSYWDPGFPEYGIMGHTVVFSTRFSELPGEGFDTAELHLKWANQYLSSSNFANIERIVLVNELKTQVNGVWVPDTTVWFTLSLGDGAQQLTGSSARETLAGGAGNDTLSGMTGNDSVAGESGADSLAGGDGNDTLAGGDGADTLNGGAQHDSLDGGAGADRMAGGPGNDTYVVDTALDTVIEQAGAGTDTIVAAVSYTLGPNIESLLLGPGSINGRGNPAANWLYAGSGSNVLAGGGGIDTLSFARSGDPQGSTGVSASLASGTATGSGNDSFTGFRNLEGSNYADALSGNAAGNKIWGLAGSDTLDGGAGADTLSGGAGNDTYRVERATDLIRERLNEGLDQVISTVSYTLPAEVEWLTLLGTASVNGTGNGAKNLLDGNDAANRLDGGVGNDTLNGGGGNDTLIGGPSGGRGETGVDHLAGGAGADRFVFGSATDSPLPLFGASSCDTIADFQPGVDRIDLSAIDADPSIEGDQAFSAGQLLYDPTKGLLYANVGADAVSDLCIQLYTGRNGSWPTSILLADIIL